MQIQVADIIRVLEEWVSPNYALTGDRIGLQVGDLYQPVNKVMVTLDVTEQVVDQAVQAGVQLIVSHHAVIYSPVKQIRTDTYYGRTIAKLLSNKISVYVAHTNLDVAEGGVNDTLAQLIPLQQVEILQRVNNHKLKKLVVFVPKDHHTQVLDAICAAGAGRIGNYSYCTFNTPGTGTYKPESGTHPFIGQVGQLEHTEEVRLETIVPEEVMHKVIDSMLEAHPYEEVAFDLYPLEIMGKPFGMGRIGKLQQSLPLTEFAQQIKQKLNVPGVRIVGDRTTLVNKVALLGGSGADWIDAAVSQGADVLVTADLSYHEAQDALYKGLALVDPGHNGMERIVVPVVANFLREQTTQLGSDLQVLESTVNTEPFSFV